MTGFDTVIQLIYLAAASCFVLGLHLMNSPGHGPARQPGLGGRHGRGAWPPRWR